MGFATARSLWRESKFGQDGHGSVSAQEEELPSAATESARSTDVQLLKRDENGQDGRPGKLKKPKKNGRDHPQVAAETSIGITFESRDFVCNAPGAPSHPVPKRSNAWKAAARPFEDAGSIREPNLDLSEYAFGVYDLGMQTQAPGAISASKKPRKKAAVSAKSMASGDAVGKGRKRKAKSEAVILNSDDPDQPGLSAADDPPKSMGKNGSVEPDPSKKRLDEAKSEGVRDQKKSRKGAPVLDQQIQSQPSPKCDTATEKSAYFIETRKADAVEDAECHCGSMKPLQTPAEPPLVLADNQPKDIAAPRRMDWTPVKDSEQAQRDVRSLADSPSTSGSPRIPLTEILNDFGYIDAHAINSPATRIATGEAATNRRRIELANATVAVPTSRKLQTTGNEAETKQAKRATGRKKLQTITALATSAYQPDLEQPADQIIVSEFFASRKESCSPSKEDAVVAVKPKKPRRPRKKKDDPVNGDGKPVAQPKKANKAKVKFSEKDNLTKLYTPTRASAQMKQQDFLFGTSSQLAVDESPAFIRDMQAAVTASEPDGSSHRLHHSASQVQSSEAMPSQLGATPRRAKSSIKVPTAPHGTCLSLEQAHRELWCVSSRDHDGGCLRDVREDGSDAQAPLELDEEAGLGNFPTTRSPAQNKDTDPDTKPDMIEDKAREPRHEAQADISALEKPAALPAVTRCDERGNADLTSISLEKLKEDAEYATVPLDASSQHSGFDVDNGLHYTPEEPTTPDSVRRQNEDSWMLISSGGPEPCALDHPKSEVSGAQMPRGRSPSHNLAGATSPSRVRSVLQPLDANAAFPVAGGLKNISTYQARALCTTRPDLASRTTTGRPRGRPRKDTGVQKDAAIATKKRVRPPKRLEIASDPSAEAAKFKKPKTAVSASQPLQSPSGWLDVDEISDSDSAVTPSPPRRRTSSSPPTVAPLEIAVDGSPLAKLKEKAPDVVAASSSFKPGEAQWPLIREHIFPKISSTIKNAPHSTDRSKPSWYQKILMYDPVTLEELTSWLNEQGLRFPVRKQKERVEKRGGKKKGNNADEAAGGSATEWEVHEEPLQAWMVQKWCEEHSVCCVWAGGGWGGRARH